MPVAIRILSLSILAALALAACAPVSPPVATPTPEQATQANLADVLFVRASQAGDHTWTFTVTVQHPDTGWDNYADGWDVVTPDGAVLLPDPDAPFTRLLLHPHVDEQPFTRSQSGIAIPPGITSVRVRGHSLTGGYGGREVLVDLTAPSGPDFEVTTPLPPPASPAAPQSNISPLPAVEPLDIPLAGPPLWVAAVPAERGSLWAVEKETEYLPRYSVSRPPHQKPSPKRRLSPKILRFSPASPSAASASHAPS